MPSRRGLRQIVEISPNAELIIMVSLGMVKNIVNWFSFTWNGDVQKIWDLPGPEPSFSAKYHFDYWIKNILSLVVLFRNLTTHLHLLFYIVMLYPVITGERPRLILPWLYLQMMKNIITDVICTIAGVLLCWVLHSCGLLVLEFLVVRIISMMPSIYLWRRLRSYYFDLYYAELDYEFSFPVTKAIQGLTLAQRRRAAKSLDGTIIPTLTYSENQSRVNSCLTYDEIFGPTNWESDTDNKLSKSLTTLLTTESQESEDVEEESCLNIIHDDNLTPAEKTLRILGLTREEVDANALHIHKRTSTTDLAESGTGSLQSSIDADVESSFFSLTGETVQPRAVGIQVGIPNGSKANKKKCECCEGTKCSEKEDTDSDGEEAQSMTQFNNTTRNAEARFSREKPFDCCDQNREGKDKRHEIRSGNEERDHSLPATDSRTISTASTYCKNNLNPGLCLKAVVERDGIAWENLKEINFVSVINKALCNEIKPFKLQRDGKNPEKIASPILNNLIKDSEEDFRGQSDHNVKEVIPEREDGTKFIHRIQESLKLDPTAFSGPTSASFGVESDILAFNTSYIFERNPISETQSFDSTPITPTKQLIRPDHHAELDSHFKSSFQRHSNMFDDTRAQLEPLSRRVHSPDYRVVHNGANEDSRFCQTDVNSFEEKTDGDCSYSLPCYRSSSNSPQYHRDNYDGLNFNQGNSKENEIDLFRDIAESSKSKDLGNQQIITDSKIHDSSLQMAKKFLAASQTSLARENNELTRAPQTSSMMFKKFFNEDESNSNSEGILETEERENSKTPFTAKDESVTGKKSSCSKSSRQISPKDRRSLASSSRISRSSRTSETLEERETKEMLALKAYNEKTLVKYKREMDAFRIHERAQDKDRDPLRKKSPVGTCGNSFDQAFYVPSVPELEKPEKELISKIEKAYARFTRSKPVDPVNSEALHGNCMTKEFFDIYTCNGRLKKNSRKIKVNEKTGMRKQHSKYSRLTDVTNESDVTSRSCKLIEGSQKGRDLDRTPAKENIRSQNMEVYFLERQIDEKPTTSKNDQLTTIKSFSRQDGADPFPAVSSEILTPGGTPSSMVEVLNTPEENPFRIDDTDYQNQLRRNNVPKNVKEAVKNIDWSFQRPNSIGSNIHNERQAGNNCAGISRADISLELENIVHQTTENILQFVFANSENSERGFRLGESANEVYPIFNTVAVAMKEIVRSAALRGYSDEFISQPATEIEIPEIEGENLYGLTNLPSELRRRSSSGFLRCSILPEDIRSLKKRSENEESLSITTSTAPDLEKKKLEAVRCKTNLLDQDETISIEEEKASSLLNKLISSVEPRSAEINIPVLGQEDVPEQPEDTSGDLPNPEVRDLEDYSSFLFKGSLTSKKSTVLSKFQNSDRSLQIGPKRNIISTEQVRLALQNVIFQSPIQKIPNPGKPQFEFDVPSCRSILDHFNTGGNEMQSIVFKFFAQFPNCLGHGYLPRNLRGSEFITELQMLTNLFVLESKAGEIVNSTEYSEASEEGPSSSSGNSSFEQNDRSERATTQTGTSGSTNFGNVSANNPTGSRDFWRNEDREKKKDNLDRRGAEKIDSDLDSRVSSSEKIDEPHDDHQRLLSNIPEPESLPLTHSELLNRANFRREVISSAFVQAIKQNGSFSDATKGTEAEILAPNNEDTKIENEVFTPDYEDLNELKSRCLMNAETVAEMPELWMTDDDEQTTSRNALVCPRKDDFLIDVDNTMPDIVLRDFETAECAIKRMKTVFEEFFAKGEKGQEKRVKRETPLEMNSEISSSENFRFPVNGELRKLQNLVHTVANYVTITAGCSSPQSITANEVAESDMRNARCKSESSNNLEEVPEILEKNVAKSNTDDSQAAEISVPKTTSSLKDSEGPAGLKAEISRFSSWDKVIPLSTKRQMAKKKKKSKPKKAVGASEPARRVVKVVKLAENKNLDFFSARSVPQRGRGLSSGYLMDSDSDGNFTVSRPPTPDSVASETSQSLSCDNGQPDVFLNPLKASEIFPKSDTSHSCTTSRPIETCWSSSSANPIKDTFLPTKSPNLSNKIAEKNIDDFKSLQIEESLELSCSLLLNDGEASSKKELALPGISGGDLITQNRSCDEESRVLGAESISTESDLQYMTSVDAAGIENKLKDVVQKILSHQSSGLDPLTIGLRIGSKNASLTSVSGSTRIDSSIDLHANNSRPEDGVEEPKQIREDCHNRLRKLLSKADDISIEQLNAHYKVSGLTLTNSDAASFEVSSGKSRVSVKHVAIGTEYNVEVFKDLVDTFEKIHSIAKETVAKQTSTNVPKNSEDEKEIGKSDSSAKNQASPLAEGNTSSETSLQTLPLNRMVEKDTPAFASDQNMLSEKTEVNPDAAEPATISYDSFDSWTSENVIEISESSCPAMSISNHTYIEEFPEQVDSSFQFSVADLDAAATPGGSKSTDEPKKDPTTKKKGIPRPVKISKERK